MFSTTYNEEKKQFYGPDLPPLYNPQISVAQALLNSMSIFGSKLAQVKFASATFSCKKNSLEYHSLDKSRQWTSHVFR